MVETAETRAIFLGPNLKVKHRIRGDRRWDIPKDKEPDQAKKGEIVGERDSER